MKYKDFALLCQKLGDKRPELSYTLESVSDALNLGILVYVAEAGKIERFFGSEHNSLYYAKQMLIYWPDLRTSSFETYLFLPQETLKRETTIGVAFDLKMDSLVKSSKELNLILKKDTEIAKTLDFLCMSNGKYSNGNVFNFNSKRFNFFYEGAPYVHKNLHLDRSAGELLMEDIDFEAWQRKVHLSDDALSKFLELGKEKLAEDIKYDEYDIPTEVFEKYWGKSAL